MEIGEFNEEYNHSYSEEERYIAPKEPQVLESIARFRDRKFGIMFHWGAYTHYGRKNHRDSISGTRPFL